MWDSLARLCIPKRYRFDEDAGSDENTGRGRLLLRQEQASVSLPMTLPSWICEALLEPQMEEWTLHAIKAYRRARHDCM